jgi:rubrerythrin
MTLEEAINTALDYENRIRDLYRQGAEQTKDPIGKKIFRALADDEQRHVDYLNHKLEQWRTTGTITSEHLASAIPPKQVIEKEAARLRSRMATDDRGLKQQMLSKALQLEIETSDFYRQMVAQLSAEGQNLFSRFLEIESNHIDAVQFELDYYGRSGYWFDFEEFDMEAG